MGEAKDTLDIRGMICPIPVLKLTQKMKELQAGDTLMVIANKDNKTDVYGWCQKNNVEFTEYIEEDKLLKFMIKKG